MTELCDGSCLSLEALEDGPGGEDVVPQRLDSHLALETTIPGAVHRPESTAPQQIAQLVILTEGKL